MLKQTLLYPLHLELNAKMVPFAGYRMPLHYDKGTLREHLHCRSQAGFFDISHLGQCLILGDNAAKELEQLTPGNIAELKPWQQKYTVLTNDMGGIIDDITITNTNLGLMLVVNAACKDKDFDYLKQHLSSDCEFIELSEQALFAIQGPKAVQIMHKLSPKASELTFMQACSSEILNIPCIISRSGYTGEDGFENSVSHQFAEPLARLLLAEPELEPIGLGARNSLRLEAGLCLYGNELSESISPVSAGLQWLIKNGHTTFPGAANIITQLKQGSEKIRVGLNIAGKIQVREGAILYNDETKALGYVTSGGFSPSLGKPIAIAYLDRNYAKPGSLLLTQVREHKIIVGVTTLPFIPHRYHR